MMEQSKFAVKNAAAAIDLPLRRREESLSITTNGTADFRPGTTGSILLSPVDQATKISLAPAASPTVAEALPTITSPSSTAASTEYVQPRPQKDNWDKIAAIAPIISAALIFATGGYCTYTYNQEQIRIQQCQTIEKFIPHLMGNEQTKKAAILALSTLINTETASKFASIFASTGTVSALQSLSRTGTDKDKLIATQALSSALQDLADRESKLTDIEQDYKNSLAIKNKPAVDNPDTPYNLNKLAQQYTMKGQYALAEPLLKRSLEIRERVYGPSHPEVVDALKSLAELYQLSGKTDLAEASLKRAREIEDKPDLRLSAKESTTAPPTSDLTIKIPSAEQSPKVESEKSSQTVLQSDSHMTEIPADSNKQETHPVP